MKHGAWTTTEIAALRANAHLGLHELARFLDRSEASVRTAAGRFRVSLRVKGSRRGAVLCQPRGMSIRRALREDILNGTVDPQVLAERMRLDSEAELCPACGARPQRVRTSGLCVVCHKRRLADLHLELLDEHDAQRDLWRVRQQRKRQRDRQAATVPA